MPDEPTRPDDAADAVTDETVTDETVTDELPQDLDPSAFVGPYVFPNNSRRRVPGVLYLLIAVALVILHALAGGSALVNGGFLLAALLLALVGAYSLLSGWDLAVDERDALVAATAEVGFAVGHASAQMGWRGWLSRPTWRILLYSAENPPTRRGLVFVDGVDARVIDRIVEDNPEDWSDLDGDLTLGDTISAPGADARGLEAEADLRPGGASGPGSDPRPGGEPGGGGHGGEGTPGDGASAPTNGAWPPPAARRGSGEAPGAPGPSAN